MMTLADWQKEGERLFGKDQSEWKFVCPSCGHIAKTSDWKAAGAQETAVAFSCVGRWQKKPALPGTDTFKVNDANTFKSAGGPCTYAGGGLFKLNPVKVIDPDGKIHQVFAFAMEPK